MSNTRSIPTTRATDLPGFTLLVEGQEISSRYQLASIVVERGVNRLASAQITLFDGDPSTETFAGSDGEDFVPGKEIEIQAGYHGDEETLFKGIIVQQHIKARSDKPSVLKVLCKNKAVKLSVGRKNAYFYDQTDQEILEDMCGQAGLTLNMESTDPSHAEMVQFYASDWDFVVMRAEANGMLVITGDDSLQIAPPDLGQDPVLSLSYGGNILEFEAQMDARQQYQQVESLSWNAANQEMERLEATDSSPRTPGNISSEELAEVLGLETLALKHAGQIKDVELQNWADAVLLKSQLAKTRGRIKIQGFAGIDAGNMIELVGMGERFNGPAFVSSVRHLIDAKNWETDMTFGLDSSWFYSETEDIVEAPAQGLLPGITGLQIGLVTALEGDPEGEDRIQVRIPMIDPSEEGIWARVASLDAGENRGAFFRPEVGDEVVLGFLNEDPRFPIVLGMLNSSAKPAPIAASDDNHEKGFVTREELKLVFNDELKSITVESPDGKKIEISDDAGSILIEDDHGNKIELTSDGINLESPSDINLIATGDVNIEGTNVNVNASANFKAEGGSGAEVSTGAVMVIKGSLVEIN